MVQPALRVTIRRGEVNIRQETLLMLWEEEEEEEEASPESVGPEGGVGVDVVV